MLGPITTYWNNLVERAYEYYGLSEFWTTPLPEEVPTLIITASILIMIIVFQNTTKD